MALTRVDFYIEDPDTFRIINEEELYLEDWFLDYITTTLIEDIKYFAGI